MSTPEASDRSGQCVRVGDRVRVIALSDSFLHSLPDDEIGLVSSMIGEIFEIDEIDQWGAAWVTKHWPREGGVIDAHSVGLSSSEMELVVSNEAS